MVKDGIRTVKCVVFFLDRATPPDFCTFGVIGSFGCV
jgi:hypothetical protein